jgi:hypothetical protein
MIGDNLSVYNPRSVVYALTDHEYGNYWTGTQTFDMLKGYINCEFDLKNDVLQMLNDTPVDVKIGKFKNNISELSSKDDVLTLLVHLGYLGYHKGKVYIPNKEIKDEFLIAIQDSSWGYITEFANETQAILNATLNRDEEKVASYLDDFHIDIEARQYNNEYALSAVINLAYFAARKDYTIIKEFPSGKGYADIAYIPKSGVNKPAMLVELKSDISNPEKAIAQIIERRYSERLNHYKDNLLYVGISYDDKKEHRCKIIKYNPNASKN